MAYTAFTGLTGTIGALNSMLQQLFLMREFVSDPGYTGATPTMMFDASNTLRIGLSAALTSANNRITVSGLRGGEFRATGGATEPVLTVWNNATAGDNVFASFRTETADAQRGSISYNRTGGLVAYNTTSDYRAKTIEGPLRDAGAVLDSLKVYRGRMNGAVVSRPMFIAHEAQAVVPYAVTGTKDAVDDIGRPVLQQIDHSTLVPLLVAEVQALRARVAELEAGR